jgi:hypothetical protein
MGRSAVADPSFSPEQATNEQFRLAGLMFAALRRERPLATYMLFSMDPYAQPRAGIRSAATG